MLSAAPQATLTLSFMFSELPAYSTSQHMHTDAWTNCVVPENIRTPPPKEDHWKFQGGGGFKGSNFQGVRGIHGKLFFQRVTDHVQNVESSARSIWSTRTYLRTLLWNKIGTPGRWDEVGIISFNVSVFLWVSTTISRRTAMMCLWNEVKTI